MGIVVNVQDVGMYVVVDMQVFFGDYLVVWQVGFDFVGFDDGVIVFYVFDGVGYQSIVMGQEVGQDLFVFGVVDVLQDDLFGVLCEMVVEFDGFDWIFDVFVDFDIGELIFGFEQQYFLVR